MIDALTEDIRYFYVIHGTIPELEPNVANKGKSNEHQWNRKILKCPFCENRLSDTSTDTRIDLYKHPVRVTVHCQFYIKCTICHSEIGINIA